MKLDDPTAGKAVSFERQYPNMDACLEAAKIFGANNPEAKRYAITNGVSFNAGAGIERRFVAVRNPLTVLLEYHLAQDDGTIIHDFEKFCEVYEEYVSSGSYRGVKAPYEDGGWDDHDRRTARSIMVSARETGIGAPVGLIINPPFPNGHPAASELRLKAEKYLSLMLGIALGLVLVPALRELNKLFFSKRR